MLHPTRSFAAGLLGLALAAGCTIPGHVKGVKTASRLDNLSSSIEELRSSVAASSTALTVLLARKDQDPTAAFHQFEGAVHALEGAQKRVDLRLEEATIDDEDLKEQSEERRVELAGAVDDVSSALEPAHEEIDSYLGSLRDTLKYLSIDLTSDGIASISDRAKSASKAARSIDGELEDVLETVREAEPKFALARASRASEGGEPVSD
jgi:chromosome segregation ATPase